jgi:CO/xanthine dehydrogenase Mo-binding subunit
MTKYSVIGKRVNMIGGTDKVTGSARYTTDMVLPGMLYGKIH